MKSALSISVFLVNFRIISEFSRVNRKHIDYQIDALIFQSCTNNRDVTKFNIIKYFIAKDQIKK